ncbi:MAG: hypothetical protein AAFQ29_01340, partial [Pseudomonadota bacterium]
SENKPIVPNWCVTWQPESPACNRTADGQISCRGSWAGVDRRLYGFSKNRDTRFHLPEYKSELPRNRNKTSSDFVCTQIDRNKIETTRAGGGLGPQGEFIADLRCLPGCIIGDEPVYPKRFEYPEWCQAAYDGCSGTEGVQNLIACLNPLEIQACTGIKSSR